jgi:circadian clock protein KaiB
MSGAEQEAEPAPAYVLTLFIAGSGLCAELAVANLKHVCEGELRGKYRLEIVDVLKDPQRAEDAKVLATPTLIKQLPLPLRRVVGDLTDREKLLVGLQLQPALRPSSNEPAA